MDNIDIVGIIWIAFNYTILCPLMMFSLFLFYKIDESHAIMKYRNKIVVYLLNVMMFITLLFERLFANCVSVWSFTHMKPNWIFYLVFSVCWWTPFFLFCVKVFDLYYKQQYAIAVQDMTWKKAINSSIAHENWFIKNKNSYGNILFCTKISLIPGIICCIINIIVSHICGEGLILDCTQFIIASIPVIFSFIMCFKSCNIKDVYHIRNEIVTQCIFITAALMLYLLIFLYYKINIRLVQAEPLRMEWLFRNLVAQLCAVGLALISTVYPVYLVQNHQLERRGSSSTVPVNANVNRTAVIIHIISNYESYKAFMQYLIYEFSTESLLFITEMIMIKHQALKQHNNNENACVSVRLNGACVSVRKTVLNTENVNIYLYCNMNETDSYCCDLYDNNGNIVTRLSIPSGIPISDTVKNNESDLEKQMKALYHKYIANGSDHQVNISFKVRKTLQHIFENDDKYNKNNKFELYNVMDKATMEILSLLTDPLFRFVCSDLFQESMIQDMKTELETIENNNGNNLTVEIVKSSVLPNTPLLLNDTASEIYKFIAENNEKMKTNQTDKE
eukprot:549699_1